MNLTLFDLDGTLLPGDSDHAWGEFVIAQGWVDGAEHRARNDAFHADYASGRLDIAAYTDFATAPWRDRPEAELAAARAHFVDSAILPQLQPAALALVQRHRDAGDLLAIVTATNDFVTRPIADLFGVASLIATDLARDAAGRVTGAVQGTPAFREGKIARVEAWLASQGLALPHFASSTFYSDSPNDLPLLERVSHPVATNPTPALARTAQQRGWPVLNLFA